MMVSQSVLSESVIAVFARRPEVGQVKTRLARTLGAKAATSLYKAMLCDTLQMAERACSSVVVCFTPDDAFEGADSLATFWDGARLPQRGGDLGERMRSCIEDAMDAGARRVLLIGSDAPDVPFAVLHSMLETLRCSSSPQLCLGPAHDGGFYAIGTNARLPDALFQGVTWSTSSTLQQVTDRAQQYGLLVNTDFPTWRDVDEIEDVFTLAQRLSAEHGAESAAVTETRAWIARAHSHLRLPLDRTSK